MTDAAVPVTFEIASAISGLDDSVLREALEHSRIDPGDNNPAKRYQLAVLEFGVKKFLGKLDLETLRATASVLKVDPSSGAEQLREAIEAKIRHEITDGLTKKVDDNLLKKFCDVLGLESSGSTDDDVKQIEDEVMLSGTENFLNQLPDTLLKKHCAGLKLQTSGGRAELVERLMVHMFELEPLDEAKPKKKPTDDKGGKGGKAGKGGNKAGDKSKGAAAAAKKRESDGKQTPPKKKAKQEAPADSDSDSDAKASPPKGKKTPAKEKEPAATTPTMPKGKWQAPPIETICKGQHDSYQALFDNFNLPDLQEYCKKYNMPFSSTPKPKLIKRILHHLETGETTDVKKTSKKGGPKKEKTAKKEGAEEADPVDDREPQNE
eukprot:TRINITY_DN88_c5_g1_i1.p1 TRINITY_DN88_c5_g1~~TRINITY_DN88_c5_g1_i1.p1  ORF type:complete len:378 (-),score=140.29 TRINITY_DN88_c5_g1_i1:101-1234(-)